MAYCGFSVHGVSALARDFGEGRPASERAELLRALGHEEARLTAACGGDCLRVFYFPHEILQSLSADPLDISMLPWSYQDKAWHGLYLSEKVEYLGPIADWVRRTAQIIGNLSFTGDELKFDDLDAYLGGIGQFNGGLDRHHRVRVLLTAVMGPPRALIEIPTKEELSWFGPTDRFEGLYEAWTDICAQITRRLPRRYGETGLIAAYELVNEPDYEWLPDEQRIEHAKDKAAQPLNKYITEQHREGIPDLYPPPLYAARTPWGSFEEQRGPWQEDYRQQRIGVLDYPWGPKFDWYVNCYGALAEAMSSSLAQEAVTLSQTFEILSGGVTHNNIDYLLRLAHAKPAAFVHCTGISIHPYHWPEADIYDTQFIGRQDFTSWRNQTPRAFASLYMKCFDFYKEVVGIVKSGDVPVLYNKQVWMTELGNGSKLWGEHNSQHWRHVPFVRLARMTESQLPRKSVVWENLWNAFFSMVSAEQLKADGITALFFYTLRESRMPGLDRHDDDRTNYSFLARNGLPRISASTFRSLQHFMATMTGRDATRDIDFCLVPPWTRWRQQSDTMLQAKPWQWQPEGTAPRIAYESAEAGQFLVWLGREYYQGRGAIRIADDLPKEIPAYVAEGIELSWPEDEFRLGVRGSVASFDNIVEILLCAKEDEIAAAVTNLNIAGIEGQSMLVMLGKAACAAIPDQFFPIVEIEDSLAAYRLKSRAVDEPTGRAETEAAS